MPKLAVDFFPLISPSALFDYCHWSPAMHCPFGLYLSAESATGGCISAGQSLGPQTSLFFGERQKTKIRATRTLKVSPANLSSTGFLTGSKQGRGIWGIWTIFLADCHRRADQEYSNKPQDGITSALALYYSTVRFFFFLIFPFSSEESKAYIHVIIFILWFVQDVFIWGWTRVY